MIGALTILAAIIDLPKITIFGREFSHPAIKTDFFQRDLSPKLGLDLAGGVQMVMSADMSQIKEEARDEALTSAKNIVEERINALGVAEPVVQSAKTGEGFRLIVEIPGIEDIETAVATVKKTAHLEFRTLRTDAPPVATIAALPAFFENSGLSGRDLQRAAAGPSGDPQTPGYVVNLEFTADGAKKFAQITKDNLGRPVAIFLDETMISAPRVQSVISDGQAVISGNFEAGEARQLTIQLNAGALPVPFKIESQSRIGPTLGTQSIEKSVTAGLVGLSSIFIFMVLYYRFLGVFAFLALSIYTILTFAIFKMIPVTLTLAGIAGFVLSIGMAVDANILIFERIREELRWGRPKHDAVFAGFARAWSSIRDSNISSLITCAILFNFGTGTIRGFALTLAIGILVSMFSAITVTKTLLRTFWQPTTSS